MERMKVLQRLRGLVGEGGIYTGPRSIEKARSTLENAKVEYYDALRNLIEMAYPRHYRVVIWGSARVEEYEPEYAFTRNLAEGLVDATGCDIITGSGPGMMQAASEGAFRAIKKAEAAGENPKSRILGVGIRLPSEEGANRYVSHYTDHLGFSTRLDEFLVMAHAVYVAPGGLGSWLELAMPLQLRQVGYIEPDFPVIVHPFWESTLQELKKKMYDDRIREGHVPYASKADFDGIVVTEDIPQIVGKITQYHSIWKEQFHGKVKRQKQGRLF